MGSEGYWQDLHSKRKRYLSGRQKDVKRTYSRIKRLAKIRRTGALLQVALRRMALATAVLLVLIFADWLADVSGLRIWATNGVYQVADGIHLSRLLGESSFANEVGGAAVAVAGISLPLYYSVLGILLQAYASAPDSIRGYALTRPHVRFFEAPAWTLGVLGIELALLNTNGLQVGPVTIVGVALLGAFVLIALAISFWRIVQMGSPITLLPDMVEDSRDVITIVQKELTTTSDREVLAALRETLSVQLRRIVELGQFISKSTIRSQESAVLLTNAAISIAGTYREFQGRVPPNSEWHEPVAKYPAIFLAGGAAGPAASARVAPSTSPGRNETWVEDQTTEILASSLAIALEDRAKESVAAVLDKCIDLARGEARACMVQASLDRMRRFAAALTVHQPPEDIRVIIEDRLGAMFSSMVDGISESRPNATGIAQALHRLEVASSLSPVPCGAHLRQLIENIRIELSNEQRIEGRLITPVAATTRRITLAADEDANEATIAILRAMVEFVRARFEARQPHSRNQGLPPIIQAYHVLRRLERRFGAQLPLLHDLDRPTYEIPPGRLRDELMRTRQELLQIAVQTLGQIENLRHSSDEPDFPGLLFYFSALEGVTALKEPGWNASPEWVIRFLDASLHVTRNLLATYEGASNQTDQRHFYAATSTFREGLRVAGHAMLLASTRDSGTERVMRERLTAWLHETTANAQRTPEQMLRGWSELIEDRTFWNFKHLDTRFEQDNDVWDALTRSGLAQPMGQSGYEPTALARATRNLLVIAVSREPDEFLHDMDAVIVALLADWFGVAATSLSRRVREVHGSLHQPYGRYGRFPSSLTEDGTTDEPPNSED